MIKICDGLASQQHGATGGREVRTNSREFDTALGATKCLIQLRAKVFATSLTEICPKAQWRMAISLGSPWGSTHY